MELVILGRDGVLNQPRGEPIATPEAWEPIPGSLEAVARLCHAGRRVILVSNEPALGQREMDMEALDRVHQKMHRMLAEVGGGVEAIFFCPHRPRERCECRMPKPGLFHDIAHRLRVSLAGVPVVGAAPELLAAALAVDARPIALAGPGVADPSERDCERYPDLAAATEALLGDATPTQPVLRAR